MQLRRTALPTAAALGIVALMAAPASAHVTVTPSTTAAGAYTVLTFSAGHGCDGSPTTSIAIDLPEEIYAVTPTRNPFWTVEKVMERLDEPITDAHGNQVTERVAQVVYSARTPLPDGQRDSFELSLQLPDAEGETLAFPVVQECQQGENPWTQVASDDQDPESLDFPAPLVTVTAPEDDGHGGGTGAAADVAASADQEGDDANGLALAGLGTGVAGLLVAGVALARTRRA